MFNQTKFLPLRYLQGLQIELEVVNNFTDCCIQQTAAGAGIDEALGAACSTDWLITQPMIKCDVITLDNQLDNEYADHVDARKNATHQLQQLRESGPSDWRHGQTDHQPLQKLHPSEDRVRYILQTKLRA
jgi:hypothetical protein